MDQFYSSNRRPWAAIQEIQAVCAPMPSGHGLSHLKDAEDISAPGSGMPEEVCCAERAGADPCSARETGHSSNFKSSYYPMENATGLKPATSGTPSFNLSALRANTSITSKKGNPTPKKMISMSIMKIFLTMNSGQLNTQSLLSELGKSKKSYFHQVYQWGIAATILLFAVSTSKAQTIQFNVTGNYSGAPSYYWVQGWSAASYQSITFSLTATSGTGTANPLVGQSFLAFCVNSIYPDPSNSTVLNFSTDGSTLSYYVGGSPPVGGGPTNAWAVNTTLKYNALKDIFYTYAGQLNTLSKTSTAYHDLVAGINLAISEIVLDYDGTSASLDLTSGDAKTYASPPNNPIPSSAALTYFNTIKNSIAGSGVGAGFTLYSAGLTGEDDQDIIFFPVTAGLCTEPSNIAFSQSAATCTGATPNNDGSISLTAATDGTHYGVSTLNAGSYDGPAFAGASAIPGTLPAVIQSSIPNTGGSYIVRIFNGANDCFTDQTVTVNPVTCNCPTIPCGTTTVTKN